MSSHARGREEVAAKVSPVLRDPSREPARPILVLCFLVAAHAVGCSGSGELECTGGPCSRPAGTNDWVTDGGGRWPDSGGPSDAGQDLGLDAAADGGSDAGPTDLGPRDLGQVDAGPCPVRPWPRDTRSGVESSGGAGGELGDRELTLRVDGKTRHVLVHVPDCPIAGAVYGLVVALHDADGDGGYLIDKWRAAARDRGYVVAAPKAARGYGGGYNWLDHRDDNAALVRETVRALEAAYPIDVHDTILTGLGVGATFANDLAMADTAPDGPGTFEDLMLVNGNSWDPNLEARGVKSLIVLGTANPSFFANREPSDHFAYFHVPELGPMYPGPLVPDKEGDVAVTEIGPTRAVDWFWP